jgi:hypothetical protein
MTMRLRCSYDRLTISKISSAPVFEGNHMPDHRGQADETIVAVDALREEVWIS